MKVSVAVSTARDLVTEGSSLLSKASGQAAFDGWVSPDVLKLIAQAHAKFVQAATLLDEAGAAITTAAGTVSK